MIGLIVLVLVDEWHELDHIGWIPHRAVTATYIGESGWMSGEYRDCIGAPTREGKLSPYSGVFGGFLSCDLEVHSKEDLDRVVPHELSVTYWGRITRHDMGDNDDYWRELRRRNVACAEDAKTDQERIAHRNLCDEDKHIGKVEWRWRCRRSESSLTCWAVN
jgi:hypothetical protein